MAILAVFAPAAAAGLAKPTARQLAWQEMEMGALIHFNMMTYGSCSKDPSTFNPEKLERIDYILDKYEARAHTVPALSTASVQSSHCGVCTVCGIGTTASTTRSLRG